MAGIDLLLYRPGSSLLHRTHPTLKILLLLLISFQVTYGDVITLIYYMVITQLYRRKIIKGELLYGLYICISLTIFQSINSGSLEVVTFIQSFIYSLRFVQVISLGNIFITTTRPEEISPAIQKLIRSRKISENIGLSLRTFPIFLQSWKQCYMALKSRLYFNRKSPIYRLKWIAIPLLIETFKRSHEISIAMDARCYRGWIEEEISDKEYPIILIIITILPFLQLIKTL